MSEPSLRTKLFEVAYRMVGSTADAEEIVQQALTDWHAAPRPEVRSPEAWLSTVVMRASMDRLQSARARRETYVGPWLPEPLVTTDFTAEDDLARAERLSLACLAVLEHLSPLERAAFLLHEVFDFSHDDIAQALGRTPAASRKLLERARTHLAEDRPRFAPSREAHRALLERFLVAVQHGDLTSLEAMLDADVRSVGDGGGKAFAARRVLTGRAEVLRLWSQLWRVPTEQAPTAEFIELNGWPAALIRVGGSPMAAIQLETDGQTIHVIRSTLNPDKLRTFAHG